MTKQRERKSNMLKSLPNMLTLLRIALIPALYICFAFPSTFANWAAVVIFTVAGISDFFDGYLARRLDLQSRLGRMLDPIADKLMVGTALILLVSNDTIYGFHDIAAIVILCRELLVSGLREFLMESQVSLPVSNLAKYKTVIQMIAIGFLLSVPAGQSVLAMSWEIGLVLLWIAALLTLWTGYSYLRTSLGHIDDE